MKRVVILIGVPGSGKSTVSKQLETLGFIRLNADSIRKEFYGDESEFGDFNLIFGTLYDRLEFALLEGKNVVIDNTNLRGSLRNEIKKRVYFWDGYKTEEWVMDVDLDTCLARNYQRERTVPEEYVLEMYEIYLNNRDNLLAGAALVISEKGLTDKELEDYLNE